MTVEILFWRISEDVSLAFWFLLSDDASASQADNLMLHLRHGLKLLPSKAIR
jgi:hypothetical protein